MARKEMSNSMANRNCEWVRLRLPLYEHAADESVSPRGSHDGGELGARARHRIERHVACCATCHEYRRSLGEALDVLAAAAAQTPVDIHPPSLWPSLESRIASRVNVMGDSPLVSSLSARPWNNLDDLRPLNHAWAHDSFSELSLAGSQPRKRSRSRIPALILTSGVAAALVAVMTFSVLDRQWKGARTTILTNRAPLPEPAVLLSPVDTETESSAPIVDRSSAETAANQLAEAELPRPVEVSPPGASEPAAAAASKGTPRGRFGFDLDHGTPMPPDSRDAKPVY